MYGVNSIINYIYIYVYVNVQPKNTDADLFLKKNASLPSGRLA